MEQRMQRFEQKTPVRFEEGKRETLTTRVCHTRKKRKEIKLLNSVYRRVRYRGLSIWTRKFGGLMQLEVTMAGFIRSDIGTN